MKHLRLYFRFAGQHLKRMIEYRADFFIGILSFVFVQAAGVLFLNILVRETGLLTWSYPELLVIYAMFQIPRGLDHLLTDNLWLVSAYVRRGLFDKYLVRPVPVLWHIIFERFQLEALGELIVGVGILAYALPDLGITLDFASMLYLTGFILLGALIYTSVKIIAASVAFWTKDSFAVMRVGYEVATLTKNPLEIYPKPVRFILVYLLPFGFTSFFPSVFLLGKMQDSSVLSLGMDWILFPTPLGILLQAFLTAGLFLLFALWIWKKGLSRYESSGS